LVIPFGPKPLLETGYDHGFFGHEWKLHQKARLVKPFEVSGQFLFVENVNAFIAELPEVARQAKEYTGVDEPEHEEVEG